MVPAQWHPTHTKILQWRATRNSGMSLSLIFRQTTTPQTWEMQLRALRSLQCVWGAPDRALPTWSFGSTELPPLGRRGKKLVCAAWGQLLSWLPNVMALTLGNPLLLVALGLVGWSFVFNCRDFCSFFPFKLLNRADGLYSSWSRVGLHNPRSNHKLRLLCRRVW